MVGRDPSTHGTLEINTGSRHLILNNGLFWGFNCSLGKGECRSDRLFTVISGGWDTHQASSSVVDTPSAGAESHSAGHTFQNVTREGVPLGPRVTKILVYKWGN